MNVGRVLAHVLSFNIRKLCHGTVVAFSNLHNNVKRSCIGVVCNECSYAKSNPCLVLKSLVQIGCPLKVQAVAKEQGLCLRVNAKGLIVGNHLFSPSVWVTRIVAHSAKESCVCLSKVTQENISSNSIRKRYTVKNAVFVNPSVQHVPV